MRDKAFRVSMLKKKRGLTIPRIPGLLEAGGLERRRLSVRHVTPHGEYIVLWVTGSGRNASIVKLRSENR